MSKRATDPADKLRQAVTTAVQEYYAHTMGQGIPLDVLSLQALAIIAQHVENSRRFWVVQARTQREPLSWGQLAGPLGMTRQAVQQKYAAAVELARKDGVHGWGHWLRYEVGVCAACNRPMHHPNADKVWKGGRKRQHTLTNGRTVAVCESCLADPARLLTIETEPMIP